VISTSPAATAVTTPLALTLAMLASDVLHAAVLVTVAVVPSDSEAVAENGAVAPTTGADPAIATERTVGPAGAAGLEDGAVEDGTLPVQAISRQAGTVAASVLMTASYAAPSGATTSYDPMRTPA
jgi:hypothetical protein